MRGRVLIIEDINAHTPMCNPYFWQNINARLLKKLIKGYKLIVNNNSDFLTRLSSLRVFIIHLALTSPKLGLLCVLLWKNIRIEGQKISKQL